MPIFQQFSPFFGILQKRPFFVQLFINLHPPNSRGGVVFLSENFCYNGIITDFPRLSRKFLSCDQLTWLNMVAPTVQSRTPAGDAPPRSLHGNTAQLYGYRIIESPPAKIFLSEEPPNKACSGQGICSFVRAFIATCYIFLLKSFIAPNPLPLTQTVGR